MVTPSIRPPISKPIALLSDVHGNLEALEAVVDECQRREVSKYYVAGDLVTDGNDPLAVWRKLQTLEAGLIRGLSDTALTTIDPASLEPRDDEEKQRLAKFIQTREALGELVLEQIRRLPMTLRFPLIHGGEVLMVHGSPRDPMTEMSDDLSDDELLALWDDDPAEIVVCGSSHVPFQRALAEVHIVNAGSVGNAPEGRTAHFTVLTPGPSGATLDQDWVAY